MRKSKRYFKNSKLKITAYFVTKKKRRELIKMAFQSGYLEAKRDVRAAIEKTIAKERKRDYDGDDLEAASDKYGIAVESWTEIIRYEDGVDAAFSIILNLPELK